MSEEKQATSNKGNNEDVKDFLRVKNSLQSYYQNMASAQTIRLIGFTAGVFTLIEATQLHLGEFFSSFSIPILEEVISSSIRSSINFLFLSISVFILFFFVFRAIFRYSALSYLSNLLIYVTFEETKKAAGQSLHAKITNALFSHVKKYPRKVFFVFPLLFFISRSGSRKHLVGILLSLILSLSATFLLLLFIW
jgi:hypothetical protein